MNITDDDRALQLSRQFQQEILAKVAQDAVLNRSPSIFLHALVELVGTLGVAIVQHDGARVTTVLAQIDAARSRVVSDAAIMAFDGNETAH